MDPVTWAAIGSSMAGSAAAGTAATVGAHSLGGMMAASAGASALAAPAAGIFGGMNMARMFNVGGNLFGAAGQLIQGIQGNAAAKSEAVQLTRKANEERAASIVKMKAERTKKELAISRGQSLAAASGGGALDPSVVDILGDLETEGTMNERQTIWNGEAQATGLLSEAAMKRFEGKQYLTAGGIGAVTKMFGGMQSARDKYGDTFAGGYA